MYLGPVLAGFQGVPSRPERILQHPIMTPKFCFVHFWHRNLSYSILHWISDDIGMISWHSGIRRLGSRRDETLFFMKITFCYKALFFYRNLIAKCLARRPRDLAALDNLCEMIRNIKRNWETIEKAKFRR